MGRNEVTARSDSIEKVTARAVTVTEQAVTEEKPSPMLSPDETPGQAASGDGVTARKGTSLNLSKGKNTRYLRIRAREAVTVTGKCAFSPRMECMAHCVNRAPDGGCELLSQIPGDIVPRDWYNQALTEIASW